jgi:hypothetical protein
MLVERKTPADNRRPVRDEICRKHCVPDGTLALPENQLSTNILSLSGHCDVDMTVVPHCNLCVLCAFLMSFVVKKTFEKAPL